MRKKTSFQLTTLQYKLRIFTRFSLGECVNEVQICSLEKWLWGTSSVQGIKFSIVLGNCKTLSLNLSETPYLSQVTTWSNWHFLLCLLLLLLSSTLLSGALFILCSFSAQSPSLSCRCCRHVCAPGRDTHYTAVHITPNYNYSVAALPYCMDP